MSAAPQPLDFRPFKNVAYAEADCRELVRQVLAVHGIEMPDSPAEGRATGWYRVDVPRPLDIALFNTPEDLHIGVVVSRGEFLHASRELGRSVVERLSAPEWVSQLEGFFRHG